MLFVGPRSLNHAPLFASKLMCGLLPVVEDRWELASGCDCLGLRSSCGFPCDTGFCSHLLLNPKP